MNTDFLDKFFRLYSKCSTAFAGKVNKHQYMVISYFKRGLNIYTYQYFDFDLFFCHSKSEKNQSDNKHLCDEYNAKKLNFLKLTFTTMDALTAVLLNDIHEKIKLDLKGIDKSSIIALNNEYKFYVK
jgi:hypothetical protein